MSSGKSGGGGGSAVVGYRYLMGVQVNVCHGPVDSVNRIIIGEREAWSGAVTANGTVSINKPDLFGGDSREGGVVGDVDIAMGAMTQGRNAYLAAQQSATCPAYRGLLSVIFKAFMWSSGNPYFKAPWIDLTRILAGWHGGAAWNAANAVINTKDMNPAHIIYQCLTDPAWGMGYNTADIDDASFTAAAASLKAEGFGLSIAWDEQSSIEDFVKVILNHINGALGMSATTGKFVLKLIRADYDPGTLLDLNESNVIELKSFQRAAFGDAANEVVVTYTDRDENTKPIAVQNLASIAAQGGVISTTKAYPGIREPSLAARVAQRDLATLSASLAQATLVVNRVAWDKEVGDVVKLTWPSLGLVGVPFRIIAIPKGTLTDSKISLNVVEDLFGLPSSSYTSTPATQWVDNVVPPLAADAGAAVEAPYWEIVRNMSLANQGQLQADYGFGMFLAARGVVQSPLSYVLSASADNVTYLDVSTGHFNPTGRLVAGINRTAATLTLSGAYDLDKVILAVDGGYAYIDDECVSVTSCNPATGEVVVGRGVLDTVPAIHAVNARMFFVTLTTGYDTTERVSGEVVYYKPRPSTGLGTLELASATADILTLNNRATRPYPPGNFKVATQYFPVTIPGPGVTVTWSHRDRLAQTVSLIDHTAGNVGPEIGVTYRLRLYSDIPTLLRTYEIAGSATTWVYPTDDDTTDGNLATLRVTLCSVRDGVESLQANDHTFSRLVGTGGAVIGTGPVAPTLTATPAPFSISVTWVFGDFRTNLDFTEVRVADVPDFNKSTVLRSETYPGQQYVHETGGYRTYKWYWVRVGDTSGLLSPWSNMVSARAGAPTADPITMLADINALLQDAGAADKLELLANRFSIKAPDGSKIPFAVVEKSPGVWTTLLNSNVLIGGNVDIANLTTGSLPNDVVMSLGGGVVELDGAGEIRVHKDLSANADFVRLTSGEIRFLRYINGVYVTYNYLSRLETGVANSGDVVTIPGYWKVQPRVMVSPSTLALYRAAYAAQDQAISCTVQNLVETTPGAGVWRFNATATLNLAAGGGGGAINAGSGATASNSYSSAQQTTVANCNQVTPSVTVQSQRGNGAGQYFNRTVRWRVEYWNGASWIPGSWRNVNMGAQFGAVNDSVAFNFPSASSWQWRIGYEAFDTDGSVFGAASYNYAQDSVAMSAGALHWTANPSGWYSAFGVTVGSSWGNSASGTISFGAYSLPSGWEIYEKDYAWDTCCDWFVSGSSSSISGVNVTIGGIARVTNRFYGYNYGSVYSDDRPVVVAGSKVVTGANLPAALTDLTYSVTCAGATTASFTLGVNNGLVTIKRRQVVANSTTASNSYTLSSYTFTLTAAQVLATGSLNWMAVGE